MPQHPERRAKLEKAGYAAWLRFCFPQMFSAPMGEHHERFWDFAWNIEPDDTGAMALALSRGGAKSTSSEVATIAMGARRKRKYALYLSESQEMADKHLESMGGIMETSRQFGLLYPEHADRKVGKYGNSRGWRRNRLYTAGGFIVDAIGADTGARGVKMMEQRPDLLIIDDYDGRHDTAKTVKKKIEILTQTIIPALSTSPVVLFPQNLIHQNSIMARIVRGEADFLHGMDVIGPVPAVEDLRVEEQEDGTYKIIGGRATWEGQSLEVCENQIRLWGLTAFRLEAQHEVDQMPGALWSRWGLSRSRVSKGPEHFDRVAVGVDPATSGQGDRTGIIGFGVADAPPGSMVPIEGPDGEIIEKADERKHGYVLSDRTLLAAPSKWREVVAEEVVRLGASLIVVERNRLGEMARLTIRDAEYWDKHNVRCPEIVDVDAKLDKKTRAQPVAALWGTSDEDETEIVSSPRCHIVGKLDGLEDSMTSWEPDGKGDSPDDIDALVHVATQLLMEDPLPTSTGRALGDPAHGPSGSTVVRRAGRALGD